MMKTWIAALLLGLGIMFGPAKPVTAQEGASPQPPGTEEQQQEKAATEKKAFALLEQVVDEALSLKLPENRMSVQITAADLLWERNEGRARSLFSLAADGVVEMMRNTNANGRTAAQLRQELVLTVARHDVPLAYQLLAATRQLTPAADAGNFRRPNAEDNVEQALLAQVAALDPKLALQNAEQLLDKGQYPRTLREVLAQLQLKDKEAAAKLRDKLLKRLQSENMLANLDAGNLTLSLLQPGPRPADDSASGSTAATNNPTQVLGQSAYRDLMEAVVDAALKATPAAAVNQRAANNFRGRGNNVRGRPSDAPSPPSDAQLEQINARRLLSGLQVLLSQIDQYLPARAQSVRQKMSELGVGDDPRVTRRQLSNLLQQGTAESLLAAAPAAPPGLQSRLYQQAALKALQEGNPDRARQIANDHLDAATRDGVLQTVEFRQMSHEAEANKMNEVRQTLSRLPSDDARIDLLLQLSAAARQNNSKLALQLLDEARQLTSRRANNYQQFEKQLKVAEAFADLEPARSFEVLEPGILQLNELLSAAAALSGFEVDIFKDGELPLEGRSALTGVITRYGEELGTLAKTDFERAHTLANRFQLAEPRILVRLAIVRAALGAQTDLLTDGPRFRD